MSVVGAVPLEEFEEVLKLVYPEAKPAGDEYCAGCEGEAQQGEAKPKE